MNILCKLMMLIGLLIASVSHAAPGKRIAVLEFDNKAKVDSNDVAYLAEVFRQKALGLKASGYVVMTKENMIDLLPPGKSIEQCIGQCEVETGRLLGASYVVTGALFSVGSELQLIVKVYDTAKGEMLSSQEFSGRDIGKIRESVNRSDAPDIYKPLRNKLGIRLTGDKGLGTDSAETWSPPLNEETAIIEFSSEPMGAMVEMDGIPLCNTPCSKEVSLGTHDFSMKLPRYLPSQSEVVIVKKNPPITLILGPNFGTVQVSSKENGLDVYADDKSVGKTAQDGLTIELDTGRHKVVVRGEGFYDKGLEFTIAAGEKKKISLDPVQKMGGIRVTAKDDADNDVRAQVKIDGKIFGETPFIGQIGVGTHSLLVMSGEMSSEQTVLINEKEVTKVVARMLPFSVITKSCPTADDLRRHFEANDHSVCVHTVVDGSISLVSREVIRGRWLHDGLKIAFLMNKLDWKDALSTCGKIGDGHWKAPESIDANAVPRSSDDGKSLEAVGQYLRGVGAYWFWSGSSSRSSDDAWYVDLETGVTSGVGGRQPGSAVVCIELDPKTVRAYQTRGVANYNQGKYSDAIADFTKAIELDPKNSWAYNNRGSTKLDLKKYSEAIPDFTKAIELDPKDASAYVNRGVAKAKQGKYSEAIADYTKAIALDPKDASVYVNRGLAKAEQGKYSEAIADYTKAIALDPKTPKAYLGRGVAKAVLKRFSEAVLDFTKLVELHPKNAFPYFLRGFAKLELKKYSEAIADFTKAIELDPNDAQAYMGRGDANNALKNYSEAIADCTKAIELDPKLAETYRIRGKAYQAIGKTEEAKADFAKAEELKITEEK
jgi:tetratricopeptide (TPR) repeat protein